MRLSQEAYDEAVTSYVENFGMDATTAQIEAREEFALQGFDISSIATSLSQVNCNTFTAVVQTFLTSIYPLAEIEDETWGNSEEDKLTSAIVSFESYLSDQSVFRPNIVDFACTAGQREIIEILLKFCCKTTLAQTLRDRALNCLTAMMIIHENRRLVLKSAAFLTLLECRTLSTSLCSFLASVTKEHGDAKMILMKTERTLTILTEAFGASDVVLMRAICELFSAILIDDDRESSTSNKYRHALILHEHGLLAKVNDAILQQVQSSQLETSVVLFKLFSHLLTSEKICRSVPEDVLSSLLAIISRRRDAVLLNHCCRCVRRLILSDSRKEILLKFDVIKTFVSLMTCEVSSVRENSISILAALALRNVEVSNELRANGGVDQLLELMPQETCGKVLRQCCILIRNIAVRNQDTRDYLVANNVTAQLHDLKALHPRSCIDVGSAALRDLGCDDYGRGWVPRTLVMGTDGSIINSSDLN